MNILNSRVLLLLVVVIFGFQYLFSTGADISDSAEDSSNQLVIVNIDEEFVSSMDPLVAYVSSIFADQNDSKCLVLKAYIAKGDHTAEDSISELVELFTKKGIEKEQITLVEEVSPLNNTYITLSIHKSLAIQ